MSGWRLEYSIDADQENGVVYEKIFGIWRPETAQAYTEDFKEEVKPLIDKPWSKLINLTNWKTSHPEVIDIVGRHLQWCKDNNMEWSVNIINNQVTYSQLMRMFAKGSTRGISKTFRSTAEGEKFLQEKGYKLKEG